MHKRMSLYGDYDHMGEAINLVENFKVEKIIFNCGKFNELEQDLIKVLDKKKIPYYLCIKELNKLKKEHTGQIMTYMNYIDKNVKTIEENNTVGIIICKQDNRHIIKYCSVDRIVAREYKLV